MVRLTHLLPVATLLSLVLLAHASEAMTGESFRKDRAATFD
jgi:hypothetical protein